jgi:hypothetical protein
LTFSFFFFFIRNKSRLRIVKKNPAMDDQEAERSIDMMTDDLEQELVRLGELSGERQRVLRGWLMTMKRRGQNKKQKCK